MSISTGEDRWLIAIDIDGTLVHDDGFLSPAVVKEVNRVRDLGHEVIIATGRSAANAIPVIKDVGFANGRGVCSNGAVTIEIEDADHRGYRPLEVITFDPRAVLHQLITTLPDAHFAVEDADGTYRFHKPFPTYALGEQNFETPLEQLMDHPVSRVVVLSPEHDVDEFLGLISGVGLHSVTYAIGYTAWLDISPRANPALLTAPCITPWVTRKVTSSSPWSAWPTDIPPSPLATAACKNWRMRRLRVLKKQAVTHKFSARPPFLTACLWAPRA